MRRVFTDAPWEKKVGYCRAVRAGINVYVSGTAPVAPDGTTSRPRGCLRAGEALHRDRPCRDA